MGDYLLHLMSFCALGNSGVSRLKKNTAGVDWWAGLFFSTYQEAHLAGSWLGSSASCYRSCTAYQGCYTSEDTFLSGPIIYRSFSLNYSIQLQLFASGNTARPGGLHARLCHTLPVVVKKFKSGLQLSSLSGMSPPGATTVYIV